jgi:hypothetical protein
MTGKPEGPGKDQRPPDPKRPHATLDLKATEVKSADPPKPEPKPAAPDAKAAEARSDATPAVSNKADSIGGSAKASGAAAAPPDGERREAGRGRSHFLASVIGGVAALAGAWALDRSGTLPLASQGTAEPAAIEKRLAAIEQAARQPAQDPGLSARIEDAIQRIGKLEGLAAQIEQLAAEQTRVAGEVKGLGEKAAQGPASDERLAKVEDRLATLAAAAGTEGDKAGRVANLAAIIGRIGDLESRLDSQIGALRKAMPEEISNRLGTVSEASEAARATAQRIDREVQTLRTDLVRLGQRAEELKAGDDRLAQTLEVFKADQGKLASDVAAVSGALERELKSVARGADVAAAVAPVAERITRIESNIEGVVRNEQDRKVDAERIVVSLELANLKRAVDGGKGYAEELAAVKKAAGDRIDLAVLDKHQGTGLPSLAELDREFRGVANAIIDSEAVPVEGSVLDRLVAGARSVVRVRKTNPAADDMSAEAVVARVENALAEGRLGDALEHAKAIPAKSAGRASGWRVKAEARHAVDKAIAEIERQLKVSLSGATAAPAPAPAATSN